MIKRDKGSGEYLGIQCDGENCAVMAPPAKEILAGSGLNNMGWHCSGGTHLCPEHAPPKESTPERPPAERRDTRHLP